jgi:hypothetical protein
MVMRIRISGKEGKQYFAFFSFKTFSADEIKTLARPSKM